jgi:RNA polymerase sigma-70 factor (ECF subfamily)
LQETKLNEQKLIKKIQKKGDRPSADKLIQIYYDEIHRFIIKQTRDYDISLDLTQETFISMLQTISYFNEKKSSFRTWLYRIATNKTIDYFRSKNFKNNSKNISLDDIEPIDENSFTDMLVNLENKQMSEKICGYIENLSNDLQKIFRLHIFAEYTFAEISRELNQSESTIKTKYYRTLNSLRKEFKNEFK